jgi:hydroxyacyl-ACP dehydratase HTD2-like protein with hotdog domain
MPSGFSQVDLALFAAATWNPHLIHLNPAIARTSGLADVVVQSHLVPARLLTLLDGEPAFAGTVLRQVAWRNRAPILPNQGVMYSVTPSQADGTYDWEARVGPITAATGHLEVA